MSHDPTKSSGGEDADQDAVPGASEAGDMLDTPDKSTRRQGGGRPVRKRDTHFLCFPLVTSASVSQLADSLRYFREITTKPARDDRQQQQHSHDDHIAESEISSRPPPDLPAVTENVTDELKPNTNLSAANPSLKSTLQILPAIAHRPPGTFHLTLGVMDLSTPEEMERALNLLQTLDYRTILQQVLSSRQESRRETAESKRKEDGTGSTTEVNSSLRTQPLLSPTGSTVLHQTPSIFHHSNPPRISLTGLSTFPSAKSSRVFYAKPVPSSSSTPFPLLPFGQAIRRKFREAGFITETRPLVLHATVANMRYAVQARGGRTSKGKTWRYGKDRWTAGQVDARELITCFEHYGGNVSEYIKGSLSEEDTGHEYIWAEDIVVDRVAICKMGAEKSDDDVLGAVYPPVGESAFFS